MANTTMTYSAEYLAQDRRAVVNAFYSLPIPLEILSTSYRLIVKSGPYSDGYLGYDDYLIVWATITAVAECIAGLVYGPPQGLGRHVQALTGFNISTYLKGDYIFSHFYDFAIASTKLSILALYHRIFVTTRARVAIYITAALVIAWLIEMEIVLGLGCQPIQGWWLAAPHAKCVDKVAFTYSTNILNLIFDLWIFSMPIPIIMKLEVNKAKRIALCFLFSIGLGVCGLSIARLSVVFSAGSGDVTWEEVPLGILSALEPCGAILCANLPIIYRELMRQFKRLVNKVKGSKDASTGSKEMLSPYEAAGTQAWDRVDNSGGPPKKTAGYPKSSATRGNTGDSERELTKDGIKVEQEFELQSTGSTQHSNKSMV
ncbi:hypothetical protein F5B22DRAFT_442558 [Xylaria bambusicola]|uniref:uncharacterized protein n=1 Tax=Xylaria bambusicola TaxID=326684 RepID=UPI0020081395|nr:uncharacterized protein F5B22DRAFT_442558 [Xylaria bambusicola]KAI0506602.1 hypothetical protein F5B22DRAFT_442558 [Xylaria bambusicola]